MDEPIQEFEATKTNFWNVIQNNTIVIPQIQRDYAQGRSDVNITEIRNKILDKIFNAITTSIPIDLDFVYGYNATTDFIPLDGQQRLTTLFLIHWYIAKRAPADLQLLKRFRYETRQSSTDFCKAILEQDFIFEKNSDLKKWIEDQRWFFHSWKKDPTIDAMLIMIQAIHLKFNRSQIDFAVLWKNICENKPITFNFLPIDNSGLTDELYIKMNSRGKPLTRFENFKVWFEKKNPENNYWQDRIDNDWTNLFWKYRTVFVSKTSNDNTVDDEFMQFINGMLTFGLALKNNQEEVQFFTKAEEIVISKYEDEDLDFFSKKEIALITTTLDWFYKYDQFIRKELKDIIFWQNNSLFEIFISNNKILTYPDRVRFYAVVHYINNSKENDFDIIKFKHWVRVSRNLIENSTIDSPETFVDAINAISNLKDNCLNIYHYLLHSDNKISFFLSSQTEEERLKVALIEDDNKNTDREQNWEKAILEAENHDLFRGSIGFLLPNEVPNATVEIFKTNSFIAQSLFDKNGSIAEYKNDNLLIRSTLATSDVVGNVKLLDNGSNWRALLKRKDIQIAISKIIHSLNKIDSINYNLVFNNCILNYNDKSVLWKYYIIKNKSLLDSDVSISKEIKKYGDYFYLFNNKNANWINNENQFLLSNFRNVFITQFLSRSEGVELIKNSRWWVHYDDITEMTFYRGYFIKMKKKLGNFNLWFHFKLDSLIVGFTNDENEYIEIKENDFEKIPGWLLAKEYFPYPENNFEEWIDTILDDAKKIENFAVPKIQ